MDSPLHTLKSWIDDSQYIVFFGGAGVSTESGIADFRSENGLYRQQPNLSPETLLSLRYFRKHPAQFYDYYRHAILTPEAKPNAAHRFLADLEGRGKLKAVITQNVDGLHQLAGSKVVVELHGSAQRNLCLRCGKEYGMDTVLATDSVPCCDCGGMIKPDVVLYGEELNLDALNTAIHHLSQADMVIVGGTSLTVYPAAGLITHYSGDKLVLMNRDATPMDGRANLIINSPIGASLAKISAME